MRGGPRASGPKFSPANRRPGTAIPARMYSTSLPSPMQHIIMQCSRGDSAPISVGLIIPDRRALPAGSSVRARRVRSGDSTQYITSVYCQQHSRRLLGLPSRPANTIQTQLHGPTGLPQPPRFRPATEPQKHTQDRRLRALHNPLPGRRPLLRTRSHPGLWLDHECGCLEHGVLVLMLPSSDLYCPVANMWM